MFLVMEAELATLHQAFLIWSIYKMPPQDHTAKPTAEPLIYLVLPACSQSPATNKNLHISIY